jgi:hypothetical protein
MTCTGTLPACSWQLESRIGPLIRTGPESGAQPVTRHAIQIRLLEVPVTSTASSSAPVVVARVEEVASTYVSHESEYQVVRGTKTFGVSETVVTLLYLPAIPLILIGYLPVLFVSWLLTSDVTFSYINEPYFNFAENVWMSIKGVFSQQPSNVFFDLAREDETPATTTAPDGSQVPLTHTRRTYVEVRRSVIPAAQVHVALRVIQRDGRGAILEGVTDESGNVRFELDPLLEVMPAISADLNLVLEALPPADATPDTQPGFVELTIQARKVAAIRAARRR